MAEALDRFERVQRMALTRTLERKAKFHDDFIELAREPARSVRRTDQLVEVPGVTIFGCRVCLIK